MLSWLCYQAAQRGEGGPSDHLWLTAVVQLPLRCWVLQNPTVAPPTSYSPKVSLQNPIASPHHHHRYAVSSRFLATKKATNLPQVPKGHHQTNPVMEISGSLGRLWPHHNVGRAAAWGC